MMSGTSEVNHILQIQDVSAGYGKITVLNNVDMEVGRGEFSG